MKHILSLVFIFAGLFASDTKAHILTCPQDGYICWTPCTQKYPSEYCHEHTIVNEDPFITAVAGYTGSKVYAFPFEQSNTYVNTDHALDVEGSSRFSFKVIKATVGTITKDVGWQAHIYTNASATQLNDLPHPIVISQGFDPNWNTAGEMTMKKFQEQLGNEFIKEFVDRGFSVILVRYADPTMNLNYNAQAALDALKWIQARTTKNISIIGPSMGGLIMRHALINAAEQGVKIYPDEFIAYDAPNWGAVIPITIQYTTKWLQSGTQLYKNLTSAAARQMLLYSIYDMKFVNGHDELQVPGYFWNTSAKTYTTSQSSIYLRDLNDINHWNAIRTLKTRKGEPIKLYAVTDGSANIAQGLYTTNTKLIDANYTGCVYYRISSHAENTLTDVATINPNTGFFGTSGPYNLFFKEPVAMENVPGGLRDSYEVLKNSFGKQTGSVCDNFDMNFPDNYENQYTNGVVTEHRGHAFIPTVSAAGKKFSDLNHMNYSANWLLPAGTRSLNSSSSFFDIVYINSRNQLHIKDAKYDAGQNLAVSNWPRTVIKSLLPISLVNNHL